MNVQMGQGHLVSVSNSHNVMKGLTPCDSLLKANILYTRLDIGLSYSAPIVFSSVTND